MKTWVKTMAVITGAVVFSTLAIQASDMLGGAKGNLLGLVTESVSVCGAGATQINMSSGAICVDIYEESPDTVCPNKNVQSVTETQNNLNEVACQPQSTEGVLPWRFVSMTQAQQLCARAGKRLPTNEEWYALALAQADQSSCVLDTSGVSAAGTSKCVTPSGISDLVGNVWEWIDGQVTDGQYDGRSLPESGYVHLVDTKGIVLETDDTASDDFGADYAKTNSAGIYGIIRGGFYGSKSDGGIFAQNLSVPLDLKTDGVGFRCVKSL